MPLFPKVFFSPVSFLRPVFRMNFLSSALDTSRALSSRRGSVFKSRDSLQASFISLLCPPSCHAGLSPENTGEAPPPRVPGLGLSRCSLRPGHKRAPTPHRPQPVPRLEHAEHQNSQPGFIPWLPENFLIPSARELEVLV